MCVFVVIIVISFVYLLPMTWWNKNKENKKFMTKLKKKNIYICSRKILFIFNHISMANFANTINRLLIYWLIYFEKHTTIWREVARTTTPTTTDSLIKMFAVATIVFTWTAQTQLSLKGLYVAPLVPLDNLFLSSPVTWFLWQPQCKTTIWVNGPGMPLRGSGMCGMTNTGQ